MKRIGVLLLAVLMAAMLFAGCAQPAAEASTSEQAQSSADGAKESASENRGCRFITVRMNIIRISKTA